MSSTNEPTTTTTGLEASKEASSSSHSNALLFLAQSMKAFSSFETQYKASSTQHLNKLAQVVAERKWRAQIVRAFEEEQARTLFALECRQIEDEFGRTGREVKEKAMAELLEERKRLLESYEEITANNPNAQRNADFANPPGGSQGGAPAASTRRLRSSNTNAAPSSSSNTFAGLGVLTDNDDEDVGSNNELGGGGGPGAPRSPTPRRGAGWAATGGR